VTVKIVDITEKNFESIPRPANKRFNCQECFYWMGKKDGKQDLVKQKKNWFSRKTKEYGGSLGKLLLWGKREKPVGFVQFGPITEFGTAQRFYRDFALNKNLLSRSSRKKNHLSTPRGGWCITCLAIQTSYRRKGLATRLVRNVLRDLKRRGVKTVDAYPLKKTNSWNQVSVGPVGLWEKTGFKKVAEIKEEKMVLMRRKW
jgi:ribosomal protein S18 acetylase RimI-like enzyme